MTTFAYNHPFERKAKSEDLFKKLEQGDIFFAQGDSSDISGPWVKIENDKCLDLEKGRIYSGNFLDYFLFKVGKATFSDITEV